METQENGKKSKDLLKIVDGGFSFFVGKPASNDGLYLASW